MIGAAAGAAASWLERAEEVALVAALALATVVPLVDAIGRPLGGFHIPGSALYVQQLTLWLAFVGGLAATRRGTHLTLSTSQLFAEGSLARRAARLLAFAAAAAVVAVLAYASANLVASNRQQGNVLP
ncbi:MAG TPA: TRAP transporter small permease subunit, partial [Thermoanaerobaculia bacterium]